MLKTPSTHSYGPNPPVLEQSSLRAAPITRRTRVNKGEGGMVVEDFAPEKRQKHPVPADESGIMLNFVFAVKAPLWATMQIMKQ